MAMRVGRAHAELRGKSLSQLARTAARRGRQEDTMTITATTDPSTRRRSDDLDVSTPAPSAAAAEAARGTKADRSREPARPEWTHSLSPDLALVDISSTIAKARSQISQPGAKSLVLAPSEQTQKQLMADAKAMLPKLEKLEKDLAALGKAMHPYMKDIEKGVHAAHDMKEGLECIVEGKHLTGHGNIASELLGSAAMGVGIATFVHGAKDYLEVIKRLPPDAKETVANAKPIVQDVMRDLEDIGRAAKAMADHALEGGLAPRNVRIGA
jgi:hypothetical protein